MANSIFYITYVLNLIISLFRVGAQQVLGREAKTVAITIWNTI